MSAQKAFVEGEVILVYMENQPTFFARIEKIEPDVKKGWWRVTFLILTIPLTAATWIIDSEQIRGADFTISGIPIRMEKVTAPESDQPDLASQDQETEHEQSQAKIISLTNDEPS